jgi:capsular polysaccharide biosynthesis protein
MKEQPLDLRESLAIIRRRWVTLAVLGALGLCAGVAYVALHPSKPTAEVQMILPVPSTSDAAASTSAPAYSAIATSDTVLYGAGSKVRPPLPLDQLKHLVSTKTVDNSLLQIEARAPQVEQALALATGVAKETASTAKSDGLGTVSQIGPATMVAPPSSTSRALKTGLIGLAAGLLLGTIVVLIRSRRDPRLRRRDQIAGAIGVPVLASLEADPQKTASDWTGFLERFQPSPLNALALRRILRSFTSTDVEGTHTIRVISFIGDAAALATGPQLAIFAAESGQPTRLAPDESPFLEPLIAACATVRMSHHHEQTLSFGTEEQEWFGPLGRPIRWDHDPTVPETRLVISVVAVDRTHPVLSSCVGPSILSVSAGFAGPDDLARVALASIKSGLGIDGVIVTNPDSTDSTIGLPPAQRGRDWTSRQNGTLPGAAPGVTGWSRGQEETRWPA